MMSILHQGLLGSHVVHYKSLVCCYADDSRAMLALNGASQLS